MTTQGSAFFAPGKAPEATKGLRTQFDMNEEDGRYARAIVTAKFGVDMMDVSGPLARKVADQQNEAAGRIYLKAPVSVIATVAAATKLSKTELLPFFCAAAHEGFPVRINSRYSLEFSPHGAALITHPAV